MWHGLNTDDSTLDQASALSNDSSKLVNRNLVHLVACDGLVGHADLLYGDGLHEGRLVTRPLKYLQYRVRTEPARRCTSPRDAGSDRTGISKTTCVLKLLTGMFSYRRTEL